MRIKCVLCQIIGPSDYNTPLIFKEKQEWYSPLMLPYIIQYTPESHVFVKISPDGDG